MNSDGTTKKVYAGVMEGRRSRGRPRMRWIDNSKWFMYLLLTSVFAETCRSVVLGMTSSNGDMHPWLIDIAHGHGHNYLASASPQPRFIFWLPSSSMGYNLYLLHCLFALMSRDSYWSRSWMSMDTFNLQDASICESSLVVYTTQVKCDSICRHLLAATTSPNPSTGSKTGKHPCTTVWKHNHPHAELYRLCGMHPSDPIEEITTQWVLTWWVCSPEYRCLKQQNLNPHICTMGRVPPFPYCC